MMEPNLYFHNKGHKVGIFGGVVLDDYFYSKELFELCVGVLWELPPSFLM